MGQHIEGDVTHGFCGDAFGDGSGYDQDQRDSRVASWSLTRGRSGEDEEKVRGIIEGWTPTVPRGELMAYQFFLQRTGPNGIYVGDCKNIIEAAQNGVPAKWASSHNINADLWRDTLALQKDHEELPRAVKVRAHRTLGAAEADAGEGGGRERWEGNNSADLHAKALAKDMREQLGQRERHDEHRADMVMLLKRIAIGAAGQLQHGAAANVKKRTHRKLKVGYEGALEHGHEIQPRRGGGWECVSCKGFAISKIGLRKLMNSTCRDVESEQVHGSHYMARLHGVVWCTRCGAFTTRWPRLRRAVCLGSPSSDAQANVKRRLERGLPPTTATYLKEAMDETVGSARGGGTTTTRRTRSAPVGRYLRLPGGPLHRPARHHDISDEGDGDGDAVHGEVPVSMVTQTSLGDRVRCVGMEDANVNGGGIIPEMGRAAAATASGSGRRRIRGKSTPTAVMASTMALDLLPCRPAVEAGWTRRLKGGRTSGSAQCHLCGHSTAMSCRGCEKQLCLRCARSAKWCSPG